MAREGFRITGTPRPGDIQAAANNMDDVLPQRPETHKPGTEAKPATPAELDGKRLELGG